MTGLNDDIDLELPNGRRIVVRLCGGPDDDCGPHCLRAGIGESFARLSPRSRELRFAGGIQRLTDRQLDTLSDLDGRDRLAWCALDPTGNGDRGAGLARYVRLNESPMSAEFAVTILDDYQGLGLGSALLSRLIASARDNRISLLRGYVLPGNTAMLRLAERFGASCSTEDGFIRAEIVVTPPEESRGRGS